MIIRGKLENLSESWTNTQEYCEDPHHFSGETIFHTAKHTAAWPRAHFSRASRSESCCCHAEDEIASRGYGLMEIACFRAAGSGV